MAKIEIKHLRTLTAIKDSGSLVDAARHVHLTQSALSHQLKELEERVGGPIVVRKSKPIRFTPAGDRLLELAGQALPLFSRAEQDLSKLIAGNAGHLHIAIECHSCFEWLMPTIDKFREHWPDIEMDLLSGFNFAPLPALIEGELDLVITSDPMKSKELEYIPLFAYESLLCISKNHRLATQATIKPTDLTSETLITYPVEEHRLDIFKYFLDSEGVEPSAIRTAELTPMMVQLVASGRGVCALPNWAVNEYVDKGYILGKHLGANGVWPILYAAIRRDKVALPYVTAFVNLAKTTCAETLVGIKPAPP
ncbi:LysR family transcriptional regulator [Gammaproteobacteria bacterium 45_16_T64]|nr:LysR family transcriptional regulator [Gammaproteobacteria bacterium 45_16_T64]